MLLFSTKFPSEIAAALGLATSTPLTEGSRKTQRALYNVGYVISVPLLTKKSIALMRREKHGLYAI